MGKLGKSIMSFILCSLFVCYACGKQHNKEFIESKESNHMNLNDSEPVCFDSIFQSIKEVEKYASLITNKDKYTDLLQHNDRIKKWISKVDSNKIDMYIINNQTNEYLMLSSEQPGSTGLASNFYDWILINVKEETVIEDNIMSLSKDKRSCFIKNNALHFVLLKYGDEFYHNNQDYDNLSLNVVEYTMKNGKLEVSVSSNIMCSGR